jgi:hypothetical protein
MGNISHVSVFYWCQVVQNMFGCKLYSDLKSKERVPEDRSGPFLELQHTISALGIPVQQFLFVQSSMLTLSTIPANLPYLLQPLCSFP